MAIAMQSLHIFRSRMTLFFFVGMLSLDTIIIAGDVITAYQKYIGLAADRNPLLSVTLDFGYGERFNYVKEAIIISAMLMLFARTKQSVYLVLAILFFYMLLDDSLQFHENSAYWIAAAAPLKPIGGLEAYDVGELIYWGGIGSTVVVILFAAFIYSNKTTRSIAAAFLVLIALLSLFGIGMDLLHSKYGILNRELMYVLGVIEDGGEMVIISFICAFSMDIAYRNSLLKPWKRSSYTVGQENSPAAGLFQNNR